MPSACPRCGRDVGSSTVRCPHCGAGLAERPRGDASRVQLSTPRPADLTAPQPPPPAPSTAQRAAEGLVEGTRTGVRVGGRLFRRLSRRAKIAVIGAIVALVVGVPAVLWVVGTVAYSPEEPVEDLVAAFNDRDLARVATLAGCTSRLCRPEALASGYEPPGDVSIVSVSMGGSTSPDTADIRIGYQLAGERQESVIRVRRDGGLLPSDWQLESGLTGALEVEAPGASAVTVAGAELAVAAGGRTARTQALLGAYTITVAGGNPLYQATPVVAPVAGDLRTRGVTSVKVTPALKPEVDAEARRQIRVFLEECARSPAYKPKIGDRTCPFEHTWPVPDMSTPASWTIDPFPEIELVPPASPGKDPQLTVRTAKEGRATVNYMSRGQAETHPHPFSVRGTVTVDAAGTVVWKP
jgi:hypothetical protein